MEISYPVFLKKEDDEIGLIFPDFPEIVSWHPADEVDEAALRTEALDALILALHTRVMENDDIPEASDDSKADFFVKPPPLAAMKLTLYRELVAEGLTRKDLAARMGKGDTMANRVLDLYHNSTVSQLDKAMAALGRRFSVSVSTQPLSP